MGQWEASAGRGKDGGRFNLGYGSGFGAVNQDTLSLTLFARPADGVPCVGGMPGFAPSPATPNPNQTAGPSVAFPHQHVVHQGERRRLGDFLDAELAHHPAGLHALADDVARGGLADNRRVLESNRRRLNIGH